MSSIEWNSDKKVYNSKLKGSCYSCNKLSADFDNDQWLCKSDSVISLKNQEANMKRGCLQWKSKYKKL